MKTAKELKQAICDAVWNGEINQETTREISERFECATMIALNILQGIVNGESGDERFKRDEEIGGVFTADGHTFTHSDRDTIPQNRNITRSPRHYIWFLT